MCVSWKIFIRIFFLAKFTELGLQIQCPHIVGTSDYVELWIRSSPTKLHITCKLLILCIIQYVEVRLGFHCSRVRTSEAQAPYMYSAHKLYLDLDYTSVTKPPRILSGLLMLLP